MGSWHVAFALWVSVLFASVCSGLLTLPRARYSRPYVTKTSRVVSFPLQSLSELRDQRAECSEDDRRSALHSRLTVVPVATFALVLTTLKKVCVAAATKNPIVGWGKYGRVPYDDFLFSNDKLLDPNFLRKSIVEAVAIELPIAYKTFRRRKLTEEIRAVATTGGFAFAGLSVIALFFMFFRGRYARFQQREIELMGAASPTSARYKNRNYNGRRIDSVEGFVDMSRGLNFEEQAHREREREDAERRQRKLEEEQRLRAEEEDDADDEDDEEYEDDDGDDNDDDDE